MPTTHISALATRLYNVYEGGKWYAVWYPNVNVHSIMALYPDATYFTDRDGQTLVKMEIHVSEYANHGITAAEIAAPSLALGYSRDETFGLLKDYYHRTGKGE